MKKIYTVLAGILASISTLPATAQHEFTNANMGAYTQNFNTLSGSAFVNNTTIKGVYAQAEFGTTPFSPSVIASNDGSNIAANYYHFGDAGSTDRSFGGIASTTTIDGTGHVGLRLKNSSTSIIRNLDVVYAMEHWYNSGKVDKARVDVSYQKRAAGSAITSLLSSSGTWTAIANLGVDAPSTATVIASRDGNSISNRRVKQATLSDINLAPGEEIMIRWSYLLNNTTNGNGLSIDDVTISAFTNIFYSKTAGNINDATTWSSTPDGNGARPGNFSFSLPNATYYVQGNTATSGSSASSRINGTGAGIWTVDGANSRIVVGLPGATAASRLYLFNDDDIVGHIDVSSNAALAIQRPGYSFTLGQLDNTSTIEYYTTSSAINIAPVAYGNLTLTGGGDKNLSGNTLVNGTLSFVTADRKKPELFLGNNDLTIQRGGSITGTTSTSYIVTNGTGSLRQTVSNSGADVLFPIGVSTTSYTPALLQQPNSSAARNEDVFSVRVIDGLFRRYDADGNGVAGTEVAVNNVKKTWLVDEEVTGNSDVKMTLQWNAVDEVSKGDEKFRFDRTKAYIGHFVNRTNRPPAFDKVTATAATAGSVANSFQVSRSGITSFSPFAVSSREDAPLPVTLVAFGAVRDGATVRCDWKTASEQNNRRFVVERSANGQDFQALGTVAGGGTTAAARTYSYTDIAPLAGTAYYRLRQEDTDGTATYSPVVAVQGCATCAVGRMALAVAPNPGSGLFRLLDQHNAPQSISGTVSNLMGQTVRELHQEAVLDLSSQPSGVYLLRVNTAQGPLVVRVVKE